MLVASEVYKEMRINVEGVFHRDKAEVWSGKGALFSLFRAQFAAGVGGISNSESPPTNCAAELCQLWPQEGTRDDLTGAPQPSLGASSSFWFSTAPIASGHPSWKHL